MHCFGAFTALKDTGRMSSVVANMVFDGRGLEKGFKGVGPIGERAKELDKGFLEDEPFSGTPTMDGISAR